MSPATVGAYVHSYSPHSAQALYCAAAVSALLAWLAIYLRCLITGSRRHLGEKWLFQTAAAAAPIPTYFLLLVVPFDPDLAHSVLDDRIVVALAGLLGLVEALKEVRNTAGRARRRKDGEPD